MITIKGRFATYGELWFDEDPPDRASVDILMFRLRRQPLAGGVCDPFLSLVSDLTVAPEALMASFGGTNRYKIKRADSKDGLTAEFLPNAAPHLDAFIDFYDDFARRKKLQQAYRRGLEAACEAGRLVLSTASCNGERLVWHAYIRSGDTAALLHSASHFRDKDGADRALVARANRWLHWRDMLAFKAADVRTYDWGGIFEDETAPEQASINSFKREFGGARVQAFNCTTVCSLKGRVYVAVRKTIGEWP